MAGTVWLLFMKPLSTLFMVVYTLTGVTDALDGAIAALVVSAKAEIEKLREQIQNVE